MQNKSSDLQMQHVREGLALPSPSAPRVSGWIKKSFLLCALGGLAYYGGMFGAGASLVISDVLGRSIPATVPQDLVDKAGGGFRVSKEFSYISDGSSPLKGAIIENAAGTLIVAWVMEGRLVLGNVYDEKGADLTEAAASAYGAQHPVGVATGQARDTQAKIKLLKENIMAMPGVLVAGSNPASPVRLYVVTWSGCSTCRNLEQYLQEVQPTLPYSIKLCPIGGRRTVDRDAFDFLGEDENGPGASSLREALHTTHDIVKAALGQAKVPCLFWIDSATQSVRYLTGNSLDEVKQVIARLSTDAAL